MTGPAPIHCDGPHCYAVKGAANKWLGGSLDRTFPDRPMLTIGGRWSGHDYLDFCSEDCLHRYVSRFVAGVRKREDAAQEARES